MITAGSCAIRLHTDRRRTSWNFEGVTCFLEFVRRVRLWVKLGKPGSPKSLEILRNKSAHCEVESYEIDGVEERKGITCFFSHSPVHQAGSPAFSGPRKCASIEPSIADVAFSLHPYLERMKLLSKLHLGTNAGSQPKFFLMLCCPTLLINP